MRPWLLGLALLAGEAHSTVLAQFGPTDVAHTSSTSSGWQADTAGSNLLPDAPSGDAPSGNEGPSGGKDHGAGGPPQAWSAGANRTMNWSRLFTSMAQTGFRLAVPRLSSSSPAMQQGRTMFSGGGTGQGQGAMGGGLSAMNLGSSLLHDLASASGGTLGNSLTTMSHIASLPQSGLALGSKSSGVDFRVSGSLGNLFGGLGQMAQGEQGHGSGGGGMEPGGGMGGAGRPGGQQQGRGSGPGVSLSLKF